MNKKDYLNQIEKELNKYELENYYDLLYQARDVINQIDEDNIEEILGTPSNYIKELFEINEIEPELKAVKKINSRAKIGIFPSLVLLVLAYLIMYATHIDADSTAFVCGIVIFFITFGTFINFLKGQTTTYMLATMVAICIFLISTGNENLAPLFLAILTASFALVNIFENIRARIFGHRRAKKQKSVFTETYSDHETLSVKMKFGAKNLYIRDNVKQLNVKSSFGEMNINAEGITHDLVINIHGSFGQININLPKDACVVDNSSVKFGESAPTSRNGNGPVVTINGNFSFGAIKY